MKNSLLAFALLICFNIKAQTPYHKMLGDTNRWYVSSFVFIVKPAGTQSTTDIGGPCIGYYEAIKDSVYNTKTYKNFIWDGPSGCSTAFAQHFNSALIREDTISRKIYVVHPDSVNECIAMDFGMNVGDSLYLPFATSSYVLKNGYYKLDSVVLKNEILGQRNHFYLSKHDAPINFDTNKKYYIEWIESIGATHFPINIIYEEHTNDYYMSVSCPQNQFSSYVTCKFTADTKYYQDSCALNYAQAHPDSYYFFSGNNCEYFGVSGNVKELLFLSNLQIFPNPASQKQITLKFEAREFKPIDILIYNSLGEQVYFRHLKISTTENTIVLDDFEGANGLYTIQIKSSSESSAIKFIKY